MTSTLFKTRPIRNERRRPFQRDPWTCLYCGIHLPLRSPHVGELPLLWRCSNCGCKRTGVFDAMAREGILRNATRFIAASDTCERDRDIQRNAAISADARQRF